MPPEPKPRDVDWLRKAKPAYDVIVIGSGLGGLTAANMLGRDGKSVCLLEQHYNYGGLATWFKRKGDTQGHIFDISLHGFPVGMKKTCRRYWNKTIADRIVPLKSVRFDNPQFQLETTFTREDFTRILVEEMRCDREQVIAFYDHLAQMDYYDDDGQTAGELFEQFFPGRNDVTRLLMEPITYANGSTLDDPALTYGIVFSNFMSKGVYVFNGGTDLLIKEMKAELRRNGVELFNHALVEEVIVEDGRAAGVVVNGREIRAKAVISNAHLNNTCLKLIKPEHLTPEFLAEAKAVRKNNSSCQVYLGLEKGATIDYMGDLFFTSVAETYRAEDLLIKEPVSRTYSFYYPEMRPQASYEKYAIVSSTNARYEDWAPLPEDDYQRDKQKLIDDTLDALERYIPDIKAKVDHAEAATPRSFEYYTHHAGGASFGTKFEGLRVSFALPEQVPGYYHAGSCGIIMSGWLGAANYGKMVSDKVHIYLDELG